MRCPRDGIIKKIDYTYGFYEGNRRLHTVSFVCTSSFGETDEGTFGTHITGEESKSLICRVHEYIKYLKGDAGMYVNKIEVGCEAKSLYEKPKTPRTEYNVKQDRPVLYGDEIEIEKEIKHFDDACHATRGRRPVLFNIWYGKFVNAIQVQYSDIPVEHDCTVSHVQVNEKDINFTQFGFEVIGFTSGSTCSSLQQQINLDINHGSTNTTDAEKGNSTETRTALSFELNPQGGHDQSTIFLYGRSPSVSFTLDHRVAYSSLGSSIETKTEYAMGTTINYNGPGIAFLVGFKVLYEYQGNSIPVFESLYM